MCFRVEAPASSPFRIRPELDSPRPGERCVLNTGTAAQARCGDRSRPPLPWHPSLTSVEWLQVVLEAEPALTAQFPYFSRTWSMVETHPPAALDLEKAQGGGCICSSKQPVPTCRSCARHLCRIQQFRIVMNVSASLNANEAQETENEAS